MKQMALDAEKNGFRPLFVDVADCADELRFVERIYTSVLNLHAGGKVRQTIEDSVLGKALRSIQKIGGWGVSVEVKAKALDWEVLGEELARMIAKLPAKWLLQIDELPVFV